MDNVNLESFWDKNEYYFYKGLSARDKLIYFSDMYSGFFDKLGDDEDIESDLDNFRNANKSSFDAINHHMETNPVSDTVLKLIHIESNSEEFSLQQALNKLWLDGFILKYLTSSKVKKTTYNTYIIIGQIPPMSLN